jgi:hypothetical protein
MQDDEAISYSSLPNALASDDIPFNVITDPMNVIPAQAGIQKIHSSDFTSKIRNFEAQNQVSPDCHPFGPCVKRNALSILPSSLHWGFGANLNCWRSKKQDDSANALRGKREFLGLVIQGLPPFSSTN